ncbi:MAG: ATP-binding protein, partial [Planctomycetota bacterium]
MALTEKREEVYNAFESRKLQLVQQRNQRASAVMAAAERVLKGIGNRVRNMSDVNEINGYFASNQMIERVRENIQQLIDLGDSVKAEDIKSQLKTLQQDSIRQLKDKQALYEDGDTVIRFGDHRFSVNQQPLERTIIQRQDGLYYHLTGTAFFEPITDEAILAAKDLWEMEVLSESTDIYRAEYLAWQMIEHLDSENQIHALKEETLEQLVARIQAFMGPRFDEGYVKGVHDHDAARILHALLEMRSTIGLLHCPTRCRTLAVVFWHIFEESDQKKLIADKLSAVGHIKKLFADQNIRKSYIQLLAGHLSSFVEETQLFDASLVNLAAEYLFDELVDGQSFVVSQQADTLRQGFEDYLKQNDYVKQFSETVTSLSYNPVGMFQLLRDWISSYLTQVQKQDCDDYIDEVAFLFFPKAQERLVVRQSIERTVESMVGSHPRIQQGAYTLNYCDFITRIFHHLNNVVPRFIRYQTAKKELVEQYAETLRLEEFQTRVLSTFVRNKLIDKVYLPLVGDNLAKQIGTADQTKRTDRQGLLLMISPPGYGKTTLMEYIANRLGLIFVKINGPAIGRNVTSFDPGEVSNMAAREELNKLNLAFEMGDNVMIYVDDIQHTNPEFLQKFISLCDAQRRVEGVYKGKSHAYDLRGKRVCIVMAGNPYTESGEKFKIPDMLSNRADIYNIGDIVGDNYNEFVLSFIENSLTSNPVLQSVAQRSQKDIYGMIRLAETNQQEGVEFEGNYSVDELNEYVNTLKKLFTVRDVVLKVNQQYIASAGQADEYRTEPPFLLQGSYRNMNRITGRVLPVMNDKELWSLIFSSYEQDAQTLTTGAESNLLKFWELTGRQNDTQAKRWADIKKTFCRNKLLGGDTDDKVS